MSHELERPYKFGGGALVASGTLFVLLALLDLRAGPPPSTVAEILGRSRSAEQMLTDLGIRHAHIAERSAALFIRVAGGRRADRV